MEDLDQQDLVEVQVTLGHLDLMELQETLEQQALQGL